MRINSTPKVSILLVDDRKEDLLALEQVLASDSYDLVSCTSGEQALREILAKDFALILLDVNMPVMDGFEVASIIKQRDRSKSMPILFMTAGGHDIRYIYKAYSVGAVDYLVKPIDSDVVRAKVRIFAELFLKEERIRQQGEALLEADRRERERKLSELRKTSERRYRNLAEAIPQIVWTADPDGMLEYVSQRFTDYTGMNNGEALGAGWLRSVHEEDATRYEQEWQEAHTTGAAMEVQLRLRRKDGQYRWHLSRLVPDMGKDGKIVGWIGTHTDFDDMKRAHQAAQEAIQLRDEFLSVASHELRTPLATLILQVDGLIRFFRKIAPGVPGLDRGIPKAQAARKQADRLEKLIENLLDVSRITSGRLRLEPEMVDLEALVRDVVERQNDDIERAGSIVEISWGAPATGFWDRLRLEQVVTNLLSNAVKYGLSRPIHVSSEVSADRVRLSVRDHGIGIAQADQERIFERFERAASHLSYGGFGLGLWITRQIVESMDGSIRVESNPNDGSTFTVELPLRVSAEEAEDRPSQHASRAP